MGFSSRKVRKEEAVFHFYSWKGAQDLLLDLWLCLISVTTTQAQCQAFLKTGEKEKSVFAWVL